MFELDGDLYCLVHAPLNANLQKRLSKEAFCRQNPNRYSDVVSAFFRQAAEQGRLDIRISRIEVPDGIQFGALTNILRARTITVEHSSFHSNFEGIVDKTDNSLVFRDCLFWKNFIGAGLHFNRGFQLEGCEVLESVNFRNSTFHEPTSIERTAFGGASNFKGAVFAAGVSFRGSHFKGEANFQDCCISKEGIFDEALFESKALFNTERDRPEHQFPYMSFSHVGFRAECVFDRRQFRAKTSFLHADFAKAPHFFRAELFPNTIFVGINLRDTSEESSGTYRDLRLKMARLGATNEEALFHVYEERARRRQRNQLSPARLLSWCYDLTARYGYSVNRPICWFALVTIVFALAYIPAFALLCGSFPEGQQPTLESVANAVADVGWGAVRFALTQVVRPFDAFVSRNIFDAGMCSAYLRPPLWLAVAAAVQTVASIALVAEFLIAVRWRFRRG
jgi:uncharacterized protein YjbI with pentapeptide repeats